MQTYYAIFYPIKEGYGVRLPDAPAINTSGRNLEDALAMAMDALSGLLVIGRKGREYLAPRPYHEIKAEAQGGELVFPVVPSEKIMDEYRPKKRINVMVPVDLLAKVGEYVEHSDRDRSYFFCQAAEQYLAHHP